MKIPIGPEHVWTVRRWPDEQIEATGVEVTLEAGDPAALYFANFWLPVIGPTCTFLAARLAAATGEPEGPVSAGYLAGSLGLGSPVGRNCALSNALHRLESFRFIRRVDGDRVIEARTHVRVLTEKEHLRLPAELQPVHLSWLRLVHQRNVDRLDPSCDPKSPFLHRRAV